MSCGKPHETPCSQVLEDVYLYLDEECDGVKASRIRQHLAECGPCLQQFGIEQEVKALVARCCRERAPDSLRERLKATLREVVVTEETIRLAYPGGAEITTVETVEIRES